MRVVAVHAPSRENSLRESIFARPPNVIHDLVATIFDNRLANPRRNIIKRLVPTDAFPFSFAPFASALQRVKNAIWIVDLIQRRRAFGAVAPARSWILRIPFEFLNLVRVFVDVSKQSTRRLAVETSRRHKLITPLLTPRPRLRIQLRPITPAFFRRKRREMDTRRAGIEGFVVSLIGSHSPSHARNELSNSLLSCEEILPMVLIIRS